MLKEMLNDNCCLSIAGLDPSGGAGILADCKTFHAYGLYACCVVTAITAQNPFEVNNIQAIDSSVIEDEIDTVLDVYPLEYIKTGMLYSKDIVKIVAGKIKEYQLKAVVDPVMISESGSNLTEDNFSSFLNKYLIKNAYIITPNIHEAEQLSNIKISNEEDMIKVAEKLSSTSNVVITGGHLNGNDILCCEDEIHQIMGNMIDSDNTHGTGCTYSSSVASCLIKGDNLKTSCIKSNEFIQKAIKAGYNKTPNQFFKL